jgi:hypothetical protein
LIEQLNSLTVFIVFPGLAAMMRLEQSSRDIGDA